MNALTKRDLRIHWLEHRLTLSESQKNGLSFQIQDLFFETFPIQRIDYVHIFLPVHEKCEVRTWSFVHYIQEKLPMVQVCVPKIISMKNREMQSILVERQTTFIKNNWGIEEPEAGHVVHPSKIDVILLPLIAFDLQGQRLGYGGGFYDRYLKQCVKATKIGLSYFDPIASIPETTHLDVPMDFCVTPEKVYDFPYGKNKNFA